MNTDQKTCFKCGETKPRSEYYEHPQMGDGLLGKCKTCTKRDVRENRARKIEYYREFDRARANLPHRVAARKAYSQTPEGKASANRASRASAERNPIKRAARVATGNAIRDGRLIREPCEVCGEVDAQAHHDDYSKPLDVRWLCPTHHAEWHKHNTPKCPGQDKAS